MSRRLASGNLAVWSVGHPIGVVMITLAVMVLGAFALGRLGIDLLPHIIYPEIRVNIDDRSVPATIMEDQVTRQLEEQLAITEDAIAIESRTREGRSAVDLSFAYGTDIDVALRDASTRLDRAKRFLPDTIDPPVIFKRDPSQIPVAEFVVSSALRDPVELRTWVDYVLRYWFVNLPGVAAAEVGGGLVREITVIADQERLAGLSLDVLDLDTALQQANVDAPGGRLMMAQGELSGRTTGRFKKVEEIAALPLRSQQRDGFAGSLRLGEVAQVIDGAEDERIRIRLNQQPGIKLSIQKQPQANTVAVVDATRLQLEQLQQQSLIPQDIEIHPIRDQAVFIRNALRNAASAAGGGALLAMIVVFLFLGSLRRTLVIGSAIPIAILVTFILMTLGGLTLNIMTLGGLALGVGMLVDSTIVMLENIYRHQRAGESAADAPVRAAREVNSAIVASTTTNLAAVLPFLFISGLVGLLFSELIFTICAAIASSMVVALTLVPALAGRIPAQREGRLRGGVNAMMEQLQRGYAALLAGVLGARWFAFALFISALVAAAPTFNASKQIFLPEIDEGEVRLTIVADPGINLEAMDALTSRVEQIVSAQPEVETVFTSVGGFVFGRSQYESPNRARLDIALKPLRLRKLSSDEWIERVRGLIRAERLAGVKVRLYTRGIRGVRIGQGDDDISLRVQGPDLDVLEKLADQIVERLEAIEGLENLGHSSEALTQEISVQVDRERASSFGITVEDVGMALRVALDGIKSTEFIDAARSFDVRLRLDRQGLTSLKDLEAIVLFSETEPRAPLRIGEIARVEVIPAPATILRDKQRRIVEVNASVSANLPLGEALEKVNDRLTELVLPEGYFLYDGGSGKALQEGRDLSMILLGLALFLVFVVMAVQYESLRNPLVIMLSVPFALIGVAIGVELTELPLSMPVWLGLIMLAGIVVNNAIVLVEYIELKRSEGLDRGRAIVEAARLRLRPILMTTLTTVVGMLPLAMALGEGAEMLQPLAVSIVAGLSFAMLVSLILVPALYQVLGRPEIAATPESKQIKSLRPQ